MVELFKPPTTPRAAIIRCAVSLVFTAVLLLMLPLGNFVFGQPVTLDYPATGPAPSAPALPQGCWNGNMKPLAKVPGHVIYDGRKYGPVMTGKVLDRLFGTPEKKRGVMDIDPDLVGAFCK